MYYIRHQFISPGTIRSSSTKIHKWQLLRRCPRNILPNAYIKNTRFNSFQEKQKQTNLDILF